MLSFDPADLSDSELRDLLVECYRDTKLFAKVFFPDIFPAEFSQLHDEIFELIDSGAPKVVIASPRGIGKTSICRTYAAKKILYQDCHFIPYVGHSEKLAMLQTENLKRDLVGNKALKMFGELRGTSASAGGMKEAFSKTGWVARLGDNHYGTLIMPRGAGQAIRGVSFGRHRPDLFIFDDFEDSRLIENEEVRSGWKTWFKADAEKAVSRVDKNWQMVYIDTLKHEDALVQELLESPEWTGVRQEICGDDLVSKAPSFYSDEELKAEYDEHKRLGELDVFAREFRNIPIDKKTQSFKSEYFKHYSEEKLDDRIGGSPSSRLRNIVIVDPAKTATMNSADSAIICVGVHREGRSLYVRDIVSEKFFPDQLYAEAFQMLVRHNAHILAVEVTGLEEFIKQPLKNYGRTLNINPIYKWLKARRGVNESGKRERISSLIPYYRQGQIIHNETCCLRLENQLLSYPRSKLWDIMDCLAYIVEILEMDEHYFEPEDYTDFDSEAVFAELENENTLTGWRTF